MVISKKLSKANMNRIPVAGPSITQLEIDYVTDAVTTCWYSNANKYIKKFEQSFADYCNRKFAISLPSCTSGLHLALLALNLEPGDEVIVPDTTWIASAAPIKYVGAEVVFCDIRLDNLTIDHEKIESLINKKTKAIIAVNLYGAMPDYDALKQICEKHNLALIEDAAESVGSSYKNKISGSFGDFSVFSFHGSKTLTTGEGGMLLTNNESLYKRCLSLRDHGRVPGDSLFLNHEVAHKYKMTDMQAALGLAQLERVDQLITGKRKIFDFYKNNICIENVQVSFDSPEVFNSYWMSSIVWDQSNYKFDKFELMKLLSNHGIDSRPVFSPLSSLKAYNQESTYRTKNLNAYKIKDSGINLPSALSLSEADLEKTAATLSAIFLQHKIN